MKEGTWRNICFLQTGLMLATGNLVGTLVLIITQNCSPNYFFPSGDTGGLYVHGFSSVFMPEDGI